MSHHRNSSTQQACAACKYQRRKCAPDCILAPYFPHDRQHQFLNAHKLFGVSNITKMIRNLQPHAQNHAMQSIIFQSDVRARDPVGGCYRIIRELEREIEFLTAEYNFVMHQISMYRSPDHHTQIQSCNDAAWPHYYEQQHDPHFFQPNDQQEQYLRILEENDNRDIGTDDLQEDSNAWEKRDSTLDIKGQVVNNDRDYKDGELEPILEVSNNCESNRIIFEDKNTIEISDGNYLKEDGKAFVPKGENVTPERFQNYHYFKAAGADLFPHTSCITSDHNDPYKRS